MAMSIGGINSSNLLTPEQLNSHIKAYAGPGAGKTHFLVESVKNIVTTYPSHCAKQREEGSLYYLHKCGG